MGFPPLRRHVALREVMPMAETRRRFEPEFREGAVRIVRETGKSIAAVARDLGIKEGTLANWVAMDRHRRCSGLRRCVRVEDRTRLELWDERDF
jgi:transposase